MGIWGVTPFQNDSALEWFRELEEETSFSQIRRKIEEVITDDYLDAELVGEALASITIIVAIRINNASLLPEFESSSLDTLVDKFGPKIDSNIESLLEDAFGIIRRSEDNEFYELLEDDDLVEDWIDYIDALEDKFFN